MRSPTAIRPTKCLRRPRRAADEIASGGYRGPLHGIPVGVKDICLTEGKVTEGNSKLYTGFVPSFDATVVARLKAAGAVIVGKAGTSELATGERMARQEPLGPRPQPRGLQQRIGGWSRGVGIPDRNRNRHRRFDPGSPPPTAA